VASQGDTIETARENLREALELFFECASAEELQQRMGGEIFVTQLEVFVGQAACLVWARGVCHSGSTWFQSQGLQAKRYNDVAFNYSGW
jgi:hypothetical protein